MGEESRVGLTLIFSVMTGGGGGGGAKINFGLVLGGCDLILSSILPISQSPPFPGNYCTVLKSSYET